MEPKKVTREGIDNWLSQEMKFHNQIYRKDALICLIDFARDHNILKEPVTKWKWAWELKDYNKYCKNCGVTEPMTQCEFENKYMGHSPQNITYWKLPGTEILE